MSKRGAWGEMIDPMCKSLEVAAFLEGSYVFNSIGCRAHAKVLRKMAEAADAAAEQERVINALFDRVAELEKAADKRKRWWQW